MNTAFSSRKAGSTEMDMNTCKGVRRGSGGGQEGVPLSWPERTANQSPPHNRQSRRSPAAARPSGDRRASFRRGPFSARHGQMASCPCQALGPLRNPLVPAIRGGQRRRGVGHGVRKGFICSEGRRARHRRRWLGDDPRNLAGADHKGGDEEDGVDDVVDRVLGVAHVQPHRRDQDAQRKVHRKPAEGVRRGSGGGQEGVRRGSGGGPEGVRKYIANLPPGRDPQGNTRSVLEPCQRRVPQRMSLFSFCFCFSFFSPEPDDGRVLHDVEGHAPHQHAGLVPEGGGVCEAADVEVRAIPFALSVHPRR
eukprot:1182199-Prorocentrum_minimum.AAC.2